MKLRVKNCHDCPFCNSDNEYGSSCNAPGTTVEDTDMPRFDDPNPPEKCPLKINEITINRELVWRGNSQEFFALDTPKVPDWSTVTEFEKQIAEFFGAPFAVATDSCTSAIELCLRYLNAGVIICPKRTYLSIPMLANKLSLHFAWTDEQWQDFYCLTNYSLRDSPVYDAAVLWRANSYLPGSFMCVSCQHQKHLSVGRLGVILCDNKEAAIELKKLSYDGRLPNIPWREQNVSSHGFHYYATPEACQIALNKLDAAIATPPKIWSHEDYPDVSQMDVFKNKL